MEKIRVLLLDDNRGITHLLQMWLRTEGFEVAVANSIKVADRLVAESLERGLRFNVAFVDLHLSFEFGGDFAKRLIDIVVDTNVVIVTGDDRGSQSLSFEPDERIIKASLTSPEPAVAAVKRLAEPKRLLKESEYERQNHVRLNLWRATSGLTGVDSLKIFSRSEVDSHGVEKITATDKDKEYISFVIYPSAIAEENTVNVGLACSIGCPSGCEFCLTWRRFGDAKCKRQLISDEMVAQFYLSLQSQQVKETLADASEKKVIVNVTCGGDVAFNPNGVFTAISQLARIKKPNIEFIVTTIGTEQSLMLYRLRYLGLPLTFYWSVPSLDQEIWERLVPAAKGQSLEKIRDSFEVIARETQKPVTVSIVVIRGLTDRPEDVELLKQYFLGRPGFGFKLMKLDPGSLKGYSASDEDVKDFYRRLKNAGFADVRIREIWGSGILAGCGTTIPTWTETKRAEGS